VREIRTLGLMWRGLETESQDHRASPRPYRDDTYRFFTASQDDGSVLAIENGEIGG